MRGDAATEARPLGTQVVQNGAAELVFRTQMTVHSPFAHVNPMWLLPFTEAATSASADTEVVHRRSVLAAVLANSEYVAIDDALTGPRLARDFLVVVARIVDCEQHALA